jgi:hypothetical protein
MSKTSRDDLLQALAEISALWGGGSGVCVFLGFATE